MYPPGCTLGSGASKFASYLLSLSLCTIFCCDWNALCPHYQTQQTGAASVRSESAQCLLWHLVVDLCRSAAFYSLRSLPQNICFTGHQVSVSAASTCSILLVSPSASVKPGRLPRSNSVMGLCTLLAGFGANCGWLQLLLLPLLE